VTESFWLGIAIVLVGGALNGSFPLPMKYARRWRWENTWLVFALVALAVLPWTLAGGFVPELGKVYRGVSAGTLSYPLAFGFLWGIAQTTFGLGLKALGMAFAFPIVSGIAALFGSLLPLLVLSPADLFQPRGILLMVSIPILFLGLALYAQAGRQRDRESPSSKSSAGPAAGSFMAGLAICIFTGIVGPSWNLGFAFSGDIVRSSLDLGATQVTSTYSVWALVLTAGFVPNLLYCMFLLFRNHGWSLFFADGWAREGLLGIAMGLLWLSGIVIYGIGTTLVGKYGTSVGFALFVSAQILTSNTLGILAGEWTGTPSRTRKLLNTGLAVIVVSVIVLSLGGLF
jgi:L-rhamnose-H+ transport protein